MRLIDADRLIDESSYYRCGLYGVRREAVERFVEYITRAPAVEVEQVQKGEWKEIQYGVLVCSECNKQSLKFNYYRNNIPTNFCPHCGARMDGANGKIY